MATVGVSPCDGYGREEVANAVVTALAKAGDLASLIPAGGTVLVKPNLIEPYPPWRAATTHPSVVEAIVRLVADAGCRVLVGDCAGGSDPQMTARALEISGVAGAARRAGGEVVNLQRGPRRRVNLPEARPAAVDVAAPVLDADLIINLPKLKTHSLTLLTGAVKNLYGCLPGQGKSEGHRTNPRREDFSQMLAAIYGELRPKLSVMDAVVAMEGEGPCAGLPRHVGLVLAATDAVALDAVSAHLMGYAPGAIPSTRIAASRGLGEVSLDRIEIVGAELERFRVPDFRKPVAMHADGRDVVPELEPERCTGCGTCVANCPVQAITMDPLPVYDRERCIHCLCCQELCPQGAVAARPTEGRAPPSLDTEGPAWEEEGRRVPLFPVVDLEVPHGRPVLLSPMIGAPKMAGICDALLAADPPLVVLAHRVDPDIANPGDARPLLDCILAMRERGVNLVIARPLPPCLLAREDVEQARALGVPSAVGRPCNVEDLPPRCQRCVYLVRGRCQGAW